MIEKNPLARRVVVVALLLMAVGARSFAQSGRGERAGAAFSTSSLSAQLLKTGLYMFSGETNSLLRLSANGLIVVDGPAPDNYDTLLKQIDRIAEQPIRLLINTDHHENRTASNARFLADGTQILAHLNVIPNLSKSAPAGVKIAPPTMTYDRNFTVKLGGIEVELMHVGNAHCNADSVVYFPNLKVVALGDLFAASPGPDFAAGGSLVGWGPVLAEVLKLDFDIAVPGTGPKVTRADVEVFKKKIDILVDRSRALVKQGVSKDRLMAQLKTDDLGWKLNFTGDRLDRFYTELSPSK